MKLIIQIPCFNEERTLPATLKDLPTRIDGIDAIEVLIVDDGSTDRTADVAKSHHVHHLIHFMANLGLAKAFAAGLDACVKLGADIIVNTDADNQYAGEDIANLVRPILEKKADIVIGTRNIKSIEHFSPIKKMLQRAGGFVVRAISGTEVPDTTSGFRAYSREAALRINVLSDFTYTLETIIQAGTSGMSIHHVPVRVNPKARESRLFSSMSEYLGKSIFTIFRIYMMYKPLKVFTWIGGTIFGVGAALVLRFLYFYFVYAHQPTGHIQSLIIAAICVVIGFQIVVFGLLADLTAKNRKLVEDILLRVKEIELNRQEKSRG